ncbi:antitoxin [Luteococcus peritonei]|uniref:Antitoxin n=1 Tax=Luteococcus peritonei TaxID=88874 RepID=A0ABW4RSI8_9ACTN
MGLLDKAKEALSGDEGSLIDKAKDAVNANQDKVDAGVDKAGDAFDARTGGKYADKVDQGQDAVKNRTGNL